MARKKSDSVGVGKVPKAEDSSSQEVAPKRRQVYLDEDLFRKGGVIAAVLGISLPDLINNRLRPIIEAELPDALEKMGFDRSLAKPPDQRK